SLAGATLISLNQSEADVLAGDTGFSREETLAEAGAAIRRELRVDALLVTRGSRGLSLWLDDGDPHHIAAHPVEVYDVAGAGDTVISAITLAMAAGAGALDAAEVANHAAACVLRKLGVATVSTEASLADWDG